MKVAPHDGMRMLHKRNGSNVPQVTYTRGTDLSGSLEGAGEIGGMLGRSHGYASTNGHWYAHNYYHCDSNGNVTYLGNSSQTLAASYRYDPYGNTISSSGSLAAANTYRFSSKEIHLNSGHYYYGFRWYDPNLQRWLNRDPIGEIGGMNLYAFSRNNPVSLLDPFGLNSSVGPECQRALQDLADATRNMAEAPGPLTIGLYADALAEVIAACSPHDPLPPLPPPTPYSCPVPVPSCPPTRPYPPFEVPPTRSCPVNCPSWTPPGWRPDPTATLIGTVLIGGAIWLGGGVISPINGPLPP